MYGAFGMEAIPGINLWQILFISLGLIVASLYERHGEKKIRISIPFNLTSNSSLISPHEISIFLLKNKNYK